MSEPFHKEGTPVRHRGPRLRTGRRGCLCHRLLGTLLLLLTLPLPAQTPLGKHPLDQFLPPFWNTNAGLTNGDALIAGLNSASGRLQLTNLGLFTLSLYPYRPGVNITFTTNGNLITIASTGGGGVGYSAFNPTQFQTNGGIVSLESGATLTNVNIKGNSSMDSGQIVTDGAGDLTLMNLNANSQVSANQFTGNTLNVVSMSSDTGKFFSDGGGNVSVTSLTANGQMSGSTVTATDHFAGPGSGITGLNSNQIPGLAASNITSGILGTNLLPTNMPVIFNARLAGVTSWVTNGTNLVGFTMPDNQPNSNNQYFQFGLNNTLFLANDDSVEIRAVSHEGGNELWVIGPRLFFGPADANGASGAAQFGLTGAVNGNGVLDGSHALWYVNGSKYPQVTGDGFGYSYLWQFNCPSLTGNNSNSVAFRSEALDNNGTGQFAFYGGLTFAARGDSGPVLNETVGSRMLEMRGGTNANSTGVTVHGSFTKDNVTLSPVSTNVGINWDATNMVLNLNNNLNLTNVPAFFARTNQEDTVTLDIFPGTSSYLLTIPQGPGGWDTNSSFITNIAPATHMQLSVRRIVANGTTNYSCKQDTFVYAPAFDPDALKLFTAITGAGGTLSKTDSNSYNSFVVGLKGTASTRSGGGTLWAFANGSNFWDAIYPLLGGTSNSCSWNGSFTNFYRIAWTVGSSTFGSTGWVADGNTSFGDTRFNPTTPTVTGGYSAYVATNASAVIYCGTASPTANAGLPGYFIGASSASGRMGVVVHSTTKWGVDGFNATIGEGPVVPTNPFNGTVAYTVYGGFFNGYTPIGTGGPAGPFSASSPTLPNNTLYLGARNASGSPASNLGAAIGLVMIGGGIPAGDVAPLQGLVATFMAAEGR